MGKWKNVKWKIGNVEMNNVKNVKLKMRNGI